jgi:hypothetical protein
MLLSLVIITSTQSVSDRVRLSYFLKQALAKLNGLGFVVVEQDFQCTTTTEVADKGFLAYELALKVLAGALELLRQLARV